LEQVNSAEGPDWKLWEQPPGYKSRGRAAFLGALAAQKQGDDAFDRFHHALLEAKHERGEDHGRRTTLVSAAKSAGLDLERFERDLEDQSLPARIGEDYEHARAVHGVFGTPTFVFPNGAAAYLKMLPAAAPDEALDVFDDFVRTVRDRQYIAEIKRPKKPQPPES
jgi:predicted DsbA family dithiol-disulfide isomerase